MTSPPPVAAPVTHEEARRLASLPAGSLTQFGLNKLWHYVDQREAAEREHGHDYKMMFEVTEEKLNEYIDKTKEAEKRSEAAEQEVTRLRAEVEQARQEGYAQGRVEEHWRKTKCR